MAAKGYCTADDVAEYLAVTFTAAQSTQAGKLIEQAEIFIDGETGRGWLVGAQTDEPFYNPRHRIYLRYAPVSSISSVTGRNFLGDTEETLTAAGQTDDDYEVRDLDAGLIYLINPGNWDRILVDYTPVASVPADIQLACAEIVANWMQPHLQPGSFGLDSYSLPDLTVKFSRSHVQAPMPPNAARIIARYRYRVVA